MAQTLPSLTLRWHNGHGEVSAPAPLPGLDTLVSAQIPPIDVLPGMGFDVLDVVKAGVNLVKNPLGALADIVRAGLGEAALAGMRAIGWGWLGAFADVVDDFGLLISAGWRLLERLPVIGGALQMVRHMGDNFLDTLAYELFGQRGNPGDPPRGNITCARQLPSSDRLSGGSLDYQQFVAVPSGVEIGRQIANLILPLMPEIWRFEDDAPPVEWRTLEGNADSPSLYPGNQLNWDIDDEYAEHPRRQSPGRPYLKIWKLSDRRILAEIGALRLSSFWPCSRPDSPLHFEHEGDGERGFAHFQVDPIDASGNLNPAADKAVIRLTGLIGWGHGKPYAFGWDRLNRSDNGRVRMSTARGSHAVNILEGPGRSGTGFVNWLQSDYYPGPGTAGATASASMKIATDPEEVLNMYFGRQYYGFARSTEMRWGDRSPSGASDKGYELYKDDCDALGKVNIGGEFPLLELPSSGPGSADRCGCGLNHRCSPPAAAPSDPLSPEQIAASVETTDEVPSLVQPDYTVTSTVLCPQTLFLRRTQNNYGLARDFLRWTGAQRPIPRYHYVGCILTKAP